eukprot:10662852-Alexandrium_andersonii.AAC.1
MGILCVQLVKEVAELGRRWWPATPPTLQAAFQPQLPKPRFTHRDSPRKHRLADKRTTTLGTSTSNMRTCLGRSELELRGPRSST